MKKFGTPIGAGPGTENEKVGFDGVGTPFFAVGAGGFDEVEVVVEVLGPLAPVLLFVVGPLAPVLPVVFEPLDPLVPPLCLLPEPVGCEEDDEPVVVLEDEDEDDEPLDPLDPLDPLEPLGPDGVVDVGAHDADTLFTGPTPAGTIDEAGVPDGTLTLNDSVCPVSSVTVTVHWSAEAVGIAAIPKIANTEAAVNAAVFSFRRINNVTRLLPPWASRVPRCSVDAHAS
jgi:hypothetical protein